MRFFVYGFAKNERTNIDTDEEEAFKKAAKHVLGLSEKHLAELVERKQFVEIAGDGEEVSE
nr:type II toxin-antitoxin system RelE/ParE family toxin [Inquilinus limosus]